MHASRIWSSLRAGLLLAIATSCGAAETSDETVEEVGTQRSALSIPTGYIESLPAYAAKCNAATGITVPGFNCTQFPEVPQGSSVDNIPATGHDLAIGSGASGFRTKPTVTTPPNTIESITATGSDIEGTSDKFYYSFVDIFEGGKAEVKVTSFSAGADGWAKAGIMLRNDTTPGAVNAMVAMTKSNGVTFQYRTSTNGPTAHVNVPASLPIWLRLTWNSLEISAQYSTNHSTWTQVGTTIATPNVNPLGFGVKVGLAVTSHNATTPVTAGFDKFMTTDRCDFPNVLNNQCDPGSRFQVLTRTADAIAVANCRKTGYIADNKFGDIAVIQYNRSTGAVCFYQVDKDLSGDAIVTPPIAGNGAGKTPWMDPWDMHEEVRCTGCHDNGALIRSPYLWQTGLLPAYGSGFDNDGSSPLAYVGLAFQDDQSWSIQADLDPADTGESCTNCHILAANNQAIEITSEIAPGTGSLFALKATDPGQIAPGGPDGPHKNDASPTSPIWMRYPGVTSWDAASQATARSAKNYSDCNIAVRNGRPLPAGCSYQSYGSAYFPQIWNTNDQNIGTTGGSATGSLAAATLTAPANTDVWTANDKFFWTYQNQGGDGVAIVKVTGMSSNGTIDPYAKAGIMARNGSGTNAINVMIGVTPSNGPTFQWRPTTGANTQNVFIAPRAFPIWLKLARTGRTWVGSVSSDDGFTWTQVGPAVTLPGLVTDHVGLAVSAHDPSTANAKANFESFDWTPATGWTGYTDPHLFVDANIDGAVGGRTEYISQDTIKSAGGDITGTTDRFTYSFKTFGGDSTVTTKILSLAASPGSSGIDPYAKAGIMVRQTADANSANVFVGKTQSGATFQYRPTAGGNTATPTNVSSPATPLWFRMVRTGNYFIGSMSTDNATWSPIGDPFQFTSLTMTPLVGLAVSSHHATNGVTAVFDSGAVPGPPGMLVSYDVPWWIDSSFGGAGGSHISSGVTETIKSSGADIYNASDQFFFAFQNKTGNATIVARVNNLTPVSPATTVNAYAKAGIMFRDSATSGAPNAYVAITSAQGGTFQFREVAGTNTTVPPTFVTTIGGQPVAAPYYLKLVRVGNTYTAYVAKTSATGPWTQVGLPKTLNNIGATALVGLAVTSHDATKSVQSVFSEVTISQP